MTQFEQDCMQYRGKILTGSYAHSCVGWDFLPIDETCPEWPCECASELRVGVDKEFVLAKYPQACTSDWSTIIKGKSYESVYINACPDGISIGWGFTEAKAWSDARASIESSKVNPSEPSGTNSRTERK